MRCVYDNLSSYNSFNDLNITNTNAFYLNTYHHTNPQDSTAVVFNLGYTYPRGTRKHLRGYIKLKIYIFQDKHIFKINN
jgi:hypothetical protein